MIPLGRLITLPLLMMIIGQEEDPQRMSSCGRVVGVYEPLQMGLSSQKRQRDGLGQHPKALRKFAFGSIDFNYHLQFFQLGKLNIIDTEVKKGNKLFQMTFLVLNVPIRNKSKFKRMEAKSQVSQTVCIYLFNKNKC